MVSLSTITQMASNLPTFEANNNKVYIRRYRHPLSQITESPMLILLLLTIRILRHKLYYIFLHSTPLLISLQIIIHLCCTQRTQISQTMSSSMINLIKSPIRGTQSSTWSSNTLLIKTHFLGFNLQYFIPNATKLSFS